MTASLPLPEHEDGDEDGRDEVDASGHARPVVPPLPPVSAADAAATAPASSARAVSERPAAVRPARTKSATSAKARTPKKKQAAPRARPTTTTTKDAPALPPPPEVPASVAAARFAESEAEAEVSPAPVDVTGVEPVEVSAPGADAEASTVESDAEASTVGSDGEASDDSLPELLTELELDELIDDLDESAGGEPSRDTTAPELVGAAPAFEIDVDTESGDAALRLRGVTKSFGQTRAVDRIDLTIPAGTFYGIVGPNGAGKTTTLSMIAGLLRPDEGTIEVAGIDLAAAPARAKRQMGILPDRLRTFDRLTGRQLLHYYGVLRGLRSSVVESRTADLARAFDLTDALGRTVSDYSTGMTKKLMLAGAMIHSPRVLVLDEPFESVDPVSSAVILDILRAYVEHGGTVVLSSHGMELVERVCSGVAVIVAGQVLAQGTVDAVRGDLTLEQRFIELAGGIGDVEGLEWLHTFSD